MPESPISHSQGLRIWLELSFIAGIDAKPNIIYLFPRASTTQCIHYLKSTPAARLELHGRGGGGVHFPSFPLDYFEIIIGRERRQASPGLRAKSNIQMMPPPFPPSLYPLQSLRTLSHDKINGCPLSLSQKIMQWQKTAWYHGQRPCELDEPSAGRTTVQYVLCSLTSRGVLQLWINNSYKQHNGQLLIKCRDSIMNSELLCLLLFIIAFTDDETLSQRKDIYIEHRAGKAACLASWRKMTQPGEFCWWW